MFQSCKVTEYVAHGITAISIKAILLWLHLPQVILVIKVLKTIEGVGERINSMKILNYSSHNLRTVFHETDIIPASKVLVWENQNWFPQASFKEMAKMSECMVTDVSHRIQRQEVQFSLPRDGNWEERGLVPSLCFSSLPFFLCTASAGHSIPSIPVHPRSTYPGKRSCMAHRDSRYPPCSKQFQPGRGT